jgi:hypothetical protein
MILQQLLARVSVTATAGGALIPLPQDIDNGQIIMLAVVGGYNADLEFATAASGAPKVPVFDDTGVTPVANNTFWIGPAREAPLVAFAAAATAIEVLVISVRS